MLNERLVRVISATFGADPGTIHSGTGAGTLEAWNSLGQLKLILELEAEFGIRFPGSELPELQSAGRIQAALERLRAL